MFATKASKSDGITGKATTIAVRVAGRNRKRARKRARQNPKNRAKQNNIAIKSISDYNTLQGRRGFTRPKDKGKNMARENEERKAPEEKPAPEGNPAESRGERRQGEKREYPRLRDANISLKVKSRDIDIITKSLDISASGVYCKVEKEIPLMSRIRVVLIVPKPKRDTAAPRTAKIETDGVVVREHPVIIDGGIAHYDVAIFFDNISAKDREALLEYTNQRAQNK